MWPFVIVLLTDVELRKCWCMRYEVCVCVLVYDMGVSVVVVQCGCVGGGCNVGWWIEKNACVGWKI